MPVQLRMSRQHSAVADAFSIDAFKFSVFRLFSLRASSSAPVSPGHAASSPQSQSHVTLLTDDTDVTGTNPWVFF